VVDELAEGCGLSVAGAVITGEAHWLHLSQDGYGEIAQLGRLIRVLLVQHLPGWQEFVHVHHGLEVHRGGHLQVQGHRAGREFPHMLERGIAPQQ